MSGEDCVTPSLTEFRVDIAGRGQARTHCQTSALRSRAVLCSVVVAELRRGERSARMQQTLTSHLCIRSNRCVR